MDPTVSATLVLYALLLVALLVVCWIILPFAVLGTKPLLRKLLAEQQKTNALLEKMAAQPRSAPRAEAPPLTVRPPN